ncbi:hypothetical protein COV56_02095 [Candidatus Kuenenbacteria bacterium CG11_big_fil_rev_8_21_14_0_20_37_9]|uniref:Type II toxin-antitoxin system RelE/ParE family toxin n=1 Tax=Candidatus Kuenenbacteria bacterium CG08_land_8_20_14_0_20_37_23 TaxID=1974617 RepID=A0A2M6XSP4_9BACT|nr:MAG: hypothetical protein COV56_02095 [Candidatus Kuenenbacteria bacterium CG11_big_fil_rev_8_21_14_0_20_37_9]PIU10663.1 MAG: hypothetical protein COT27_01895 [Candidatus Kuenenbacteria bacterium CG08_land_8_20_14_0_20_37_23]
MYKIFLTSNAKKSLFKLPQETVEKINRVFDILQHNPFTADHHIKKLHQPLIGYRYKVWPYRILYTVDNSQKIIVVYRIFHRGRGY